MIGSGVIRNRFSVRYCSRLTQSSRCIDGIVGNSRSFSQTRVLRRPLSEINVRRDEGWMDAGYTTTPSVTAEPEDIYRTRVLSRTLPTYRSDPVVWTTSSDPLCSSQIQSYDIKGFLRLNQLLTEADIEALKADIDILVSNPIIRSTNRCIIEKSSGEVRSLYGVHVLSPVVRALLKSPKIKDIARQILGSDVYIHQSRVNFKPPFVGKGFFWHSDFETWHAEDGMPIPRAFSLSINLSDNRGANGPLMIIPGSHKTFISCVGSTPENHHVQSLRQQEVGVADEASLSMLVKQAGGIEVLTGPAGSAVMFDSNCMHGSSDNITPFGRCNLFVAFNSVENTLKAPYCAKTRRPEYITSTEFAPI